MTIINNKTNNKTEQAILAELKDIEGYEAVPLKQRYPWESSYDLIIQSAVKYGDDDALGFLTTAEKNETPINVSFNELAAKVNQTANLLHSLGVEGTDAVSIVLPSLLETHYALWGSQAAGIANPINPLLELEHTGEIMRAVEAKVLITLGPDENPELWQKIESLMECVPTLNTILLVGDNPSLPTLEHSRVRLLNFSSEIDKQERRKLNSQRKFTGDQIAAYFHTGGTTGRPKVARITHGGIAFISQMQADRSAYKGRSATLCALPLFHIYGVIVVGIASLFGGRKVVLMTASGFRHPNVLPNWWHHIARFKSKGFAAVPTILTVLLNLPVGDEDISCLEDVGCGSAPLPKKVHIDFEKKFNVVITNGYGMTESTCLLARPYTDEGETIGHVGRRFPYMQMKIAELDGTRLVKECHEGDVGAVLIKGPHVFAGYLNPEDNKNVWVDHTWFNTGDRGFIDSNGNLTLTGRAKDLIIRGGHNIDPALIEDPLSKHPAVAMAVAIGQPDPYAGEIPVVYVTLTPGGATDVDHLMAYCQQGISERAAVPKRIEIIDSIPLTAVAKIYKPELRNRATQFAINTVLKEAGINATVTASHDPRRGQVAHIKLAQTSEQASAEQALTGFAVTIEFLT
jgi:fatty-acyl-CoA synthase